VDTVNIQAVSNGTFVFSRALAPWAQIYPLASGVFRAFMRLQVTDPVVWYSWASDGSEKGSISFTPTMANGTITFAANPAAGDSIQIGSTLVTFVTGTATGNQVQIGLTLEATMAALLAFLNASSDSQIVLCSYSVAEYVLSIVYKTTSMAGNQFIIAASAATPSATTLYGAGGVMQMSAPIGDIQNFSGVYVYDCRWEYSSDIVYLFGGTLTWIEGVTR
jgi:hypothetical protein